MRRLARQDIRGIEGLRTFLKNHEPDWSRVNLVGLDLRRPDIDDAMLMQEFGSGTAFLSCQMTAALARKAVAADALVVPTRPGLAFNPFRAELYRAHDLLAGYRADDPDTYLATPDWRCYLAAMDKITKQKRSDLGLDDAVFLRLHDLAIEDALDEYLKPASSGPGPAKRVVGIMGGHDRDRLEKVRGEDGSPTEKDAPYMQVALLAWRLAREGFTVATGGGPGAMEASNLGAWFANREEADLRAAVRTLERVPRVRPVAKGSSDWNSGEWLAPAFEVMKAHPRETADPRTESIGVPTWFYGHEPPNPFASHIAKFFENSIREEGVLAIATHGVIFAEGNAGTVQEIFQDACQNYYSTIGPPSPMVLLGTRYWNRVGPKVDETGAKPVWPLLAQLGVEKGFSHLLRITDDLDEIVAFLLDPGTSERAS
jgi:predicted Rossmann-fold nucleotide-binding protein